MHNVPPDPSPELGDCLDCEDASDSCSQHGCELPAAFTFVWPGCTRASICERHVPVLVSVAEGLLLTRDSLALRKVDAAPTDDMLEQRDRAAAVARVLESCHEELVRLEMIVTSDATDINVLSAAKGYVARARNLLRGRFQ